MKKIILLALSLVMFGAANAQEAGQFRVSPAFIYGTGAGSEIDSDDDLEEKGQVGGSIGLEYYILDRLSVNASYEIYLKNDLASVGSNDITSSYRVANLDLRYIFIDQLVDLYFLGGVCRMSYDFSEDVVFGDDDKLDEFRGGFNVGAGILVPLSNTVSFNGQVKYQRAFDSDSSVETAFDGQVVAGVGISFTIFQLN